MQQIKDSGFTNLLIRKSFSEWSLIELSDKRLCQKVTDIQAIKGLISQRAKFISSKKESIYIESNSGYYGLIDLVPSVYKRYRLAFLVRDGRDWVRSWMNWGFMYDKNILINKISHSWPTAEEVPNDPCATQWRSMDRFSRICWAWATINGFAIKTVQNQENSRVFCFEDIFNNNNSAEPFKEIVNFCLSDEIIEEYSLAPAESWFQKQVHGSAGVFPHWREWTTEQNDTFMKICGPLMEQLGYL